MPNDGVYPNVVVEVELAVNNEDPTKLIGDANKYLSAMTLTTIWIGVMIWLAGGKFWIGWEESVPGGVGAVIHTETQFPKNFTSVGTITNIWYTIPMETVFGAGILIPANVPVNLEIEMERIREIIVESI
jgi:hypothetical protein